MRAFCPDASRLSLVYPSELAAALFFLLLTVRPVSFVTLLER